MEKFFLKKLFLLAVPCLLSAQVFAQVADALPVIVFSEKEAITADEVVSYVKRRVDLKGMARTEAGLDLVVKEIAEIRTLVLEGEEKGIQKTSEAAVSKLDEVYAMTVMNSLMPKCEKPQSEKEARNFYQQNPTAFFVPGRVRVSRIMLKENWQMSEDLKLLDWLENAAREIVSGQKTFDHFVSQAREKDKNLLQGDLGWIWLSEDSRLLRALNSAKVSELVGPIHEDGAVYLFQINAKVDSRQMSWEEAAPNAQKRAFEYCREKGRLQVRDQLFKKYGVRINGEVIKKMVAPPTLVEKK